MTHEQAVGTLPANTDFVMRCYRDGSSATGAYTSNRWFLGHSRADGREGFVHSSFVRNQARVPECSTLVYVRAADRALSQRGKVKMDTADANYFGAAS